MSSIASDIWGEIYRDHYEGRVHPHVYERDDGRLDHVDSAESSFVAPRSEAERGFLDALAGPVLDVGAGAGSYAIYLQQRGLAVTAIDASAGAIDVCRRRGCRDARVMDLRSLVVPQHHYRSIIVMGNTLGIHQSPQTLPSLLRALADACSPGARLFCVTIDPLDTTEPDHLRYHERNRQRGQPPGTSSFRLRYRGREDAWCRLWMPTRDELAAAARTGGWTLAAEEAHGVQRLRLFDLASSGG